MISIDIGGTNTRIATLINDKIKIIAEFPTDNLHPQTTCDAIVDKINEFDHEKINILAPGPHNFEKTCFLNPPNLPGWHNFAISKYFSNRLDNCETKLLNDAKGAAIGEYYINKCENSLLFFTISTGVGCGYVVNGNLIDGNNGIANEVFETLIKTDNNKYLTIEQICSGTGIYDTAILRGLEVKNTKEVFELYNVNDIATYIIDNAIETLSIFIFNTNRFVDSEIISLGGSVVLKNDLFYSQVSHRLYELGCNAKIVKANNDGYSGLLGGLKI